MIMNDSIEDQIEMLKVIKENYQKQSQELLKKTINEYMARHPQLACIVWTQYTPYSNDGEECTFRIGGPEYYNLIDGVEFDLDSEDVASFSYGEDGETCENIGYKHPDNEKHKPFTRMIHDNSEILQHIFDNHVIVTITRDEIVDDEYEHE